MRRFLALIVIPLLAGAVLAGCGSSKPAVSPSSSAAANSSVTASGSFGYEPTVTIPKAKAGSQLTVKTLINGTGTTLTKSDTLAAHFVVYTWDGTASSRRGSTFGNPPSLLPSNALPGLETALIGKKVAAASSL
jgi:hypothetical protein